MDNYTLLLEEFHLSEQEQSCAPEVKNNLTQYANLIDEIRANRQIKKSSLLRRKGEKAKFILQTPRTSARAATSMSKRITENQSFAESQNLEQINNGILKKQLEVLEKSLANIKNEVRQFEGQLAVFGKKQDEIKQLRYLAKRDLQKIEIEAKNFKTEMALQEQKNQRHIEQLQSQRQNLQHQNKYLAEQFSQMKHKTKLKKFGLLLAGGTIAYGLDNQNNRSAIADPPVHSQLYTKKDIQGNLRMFYYLLVLKRNWSLNLSSKPFQECQTEAEKQLKPQIHFHFLNKQQIFEYYLNKYGVNSVRGLALTMIDFYRSIMKSSNKLEKISSQLNVRLSELTQERDELDKILNRLRGDSEKLTITLIAETDKDLKQKHSDIKKRCRSLVQIIEREYKLADRLKRLTETLDRITKPRNEVSEIKLSTGQSSFGKKTEFFLGKEKKQPSNASSSKNIPLNTSQTSSYLCPPRSVLDSRPSLIRNNSTNTNKLIKKDSSSVNQFEQPSQVRINSTLATVESLLYRNPKLLIFQWYNVIRNGPDGANILTTILENDLYRMMFEPNCYDPQLDEIGNELKCMNESFQGYHKLIGSLADLLMDYIKSTLEAVRELSTPSRKLLLAEGAKQDSPSFVIESKGYYRRDNFKLLQKLQVLELKKKGLYIPYNYGISVEEELVTDTTREEKQSKQKMKILKSARDVRTTVPNASNYITTYRERVGKAERKIRNLIRNAEVLRKSRVSDKYLLTSRRLMDISYGQE